jgi:hypothetical protein
MGTLAGCFAPAEPTRERSVTDTSDTIVALRGRLREVVLPLLGGRGTRGPRDTRRS